MRSHAARALGIDDDAIRRGLESVRGVPGRFESVDDGQPFHVIVDYAHKPDALENVLRARDDLADGNRVICVLGAGGDRDRGKRPLMGRLASELADVAIITSDNPRSEDPEAIIDEIVSGAEGHVEVELDRDAAIPRAIELAAAATSSLIAGKGAEQGQEFADRTIPFDDREAAKEALKALEAHLIPLPLDEVRALSLAGSRARRTSSRASSRLAPRRTGRPLRRGRRR